MKKLVLIFAVTSLSLLTFVSCGKSNDSKNVKQQAPPPAPAPEQNGAPVPAADNLGLDSTANPSVAKGPGSAAKRPGGISSGEADMNSTDSSQSSTSSLGKKTSVSDLKFDEAEAVTTGGQLKGLSYTSAGRDGLMAAFKSKSKSVSPEQQTLNQKLAQAIVSAKLNRIATTGEVFIQLTLNEFEKYQTYKIKAIPDGLKMKLVSAAKTGDLEFQGGFLKCTDLDGGCENAYVKIKMSGAYTRIIFRSSFADSHFGIYKNEQLALNLKFDLWKSYVLNSTSNAATNRKIDYVQVSSFEVLNGKSGMGALLTTYDQNMLGLSIPLVAVNKGSVGSIPVAKLAQISKNYDLAILPNTYSQKLSEAINNVQLIANNGLGQLRMILSFSADIQDSKIFMTLSRIQKPTISISDLQKFEAAIPNF